MEDRLVKNIPYAQALELAGLVEYKEGQVVSRTFAQNPHLSFTLFAFEKGEGISAHTVTADAVVLILDGKASITIGEKTLTASAGQAVAMPEGVPHGLKAEERFKMLLFVVRRLSQID